MVGFGKLLRQLAAPWLVALGRLAKSPLFYATASRMDPLSFRSQLLRAGIEGRSTETPSRLLTAAKLSFACNGADSVISNNFSSSHAQLLQDIVALLASNQKRNGYFVEVGVGDGTHLSNTLLLERDFGWNGLLIEPNRDSHDSIKAARKAQLLTKAAYSRGGEQVTFTSMRGIGELSGISTHLDRTRATKDMENYEVETALLDDLLKIAGAPREIDFMSIDTEGSELEILKGLSLNDWHVKFFAIEHNHQAGKIAALNAWLEPLGYKQILQDVSEFDGWFVHRSVASIYFR